MDGSGGSSSCSSFHPVPPFSVNILWPGYRDGDGADGAPPPLDALLPGVYRDDDEGGGLLPRLAVPSLAPAYLATELGLGRLDGFSHHWFWLLGAPALPRPLHDCAHRGRAICVTERMDRHLGLGLGVGTRGGGAKRDLLYLKPLPRLLLDTRFWDQVLACECRRDDASSSEKLLQRLEPKKKRLQQGAAAGAPAGTAAGSTTTSNSSPGGSVRSSQRASQRTSQGTTAASTSSSRSSATCSKRHLWDCALGFLYSYAALVAHESDFRIAQDHGLLPPEVTWARWRALTRQVAASPDVAAGRFHQRFLYGELRLNRLREISQLRRGGLLPVLIGRLDRFARFFHNNVRWLASLVAYIAIVLTALQTGLATDGALSTSRAFQSLASGFTVFALVAPLSILLAFGLYFGLSLVYHVAVHLLTTHLFVGAGGQALLEGVDVFHHWDSKSEV